MNYLINRTNYPFNDAQIPDGLEELLCDISREVLRGQPTTNGIYDFIGTYLEKMLHTRDALEANEAILNDIINNAADIAHDLCNTGLDCTKAEAVAEIVRCFFEKFIDEKRKENYANREFEFKEVDVILELINKCKLTQAEVFRSQPIIFEAYQKFVTNYLKALEETMLPPHVLDCAVQMTVDRHIAKKSQLPVFIRAATTIQAAFKGYILRKRIKEFKNLVDKTSEIMQRSQKSVGYNNVDKSEVVLLILTYRLSIAASNDTLHFPVQSLSNLHTMVKSVNEGDLKTFLRISEADERLHTEHEAATKIQRIYRRFRLRNSSNLSNRRFSVVQEVPAHNNLLQFAKNRRFSRTDEKDND